MANRKTSLGCLFWLALILLVIVIILANIKTANEIIKKTGFRETISELFKGKTKEKNEESPETEEPKQTLEPGDNLDDNNQDNTNQIHEQNQNKEPEETEEPEPSATPESEQENTRKRLRKALIYFIKVDEEGVIHLKGFERAVYYNDSPLTETLVTLLKGPQSKEINLEYYSMIPENTHINNIYVKNQIAYIDFNDSFRFNPLGREGLKAQLNQIVYTATEFSTVSKVQILIDGAKVNYLGPEGLFIGEPLSRASLIASEWGKQ